MASNATKESKRYQKIRSITLLIIAEILAMSLWFVSAAILGDMSREANVTASAQAALSSAVQAGFVLGALLSAVLGIADRYEPRFVFAFFCIVAAVANALILVAIPGSFEAIILRAVTGASLAGVYPVGMKIAVGWGQKDRGLLVGLLVGGLTLGSASPHLLAYIGGTEWRVTVLTASTLAIVAALIVLAVRNGPFHTRAATFNPNAIMHAWTNHSIRRAYFGYLGHMWELYAMWSWIGVALTISFSYQMPSDTASDFAKLITFIVVASGTISCGIAGWVADKIGKAELTIIAMAISGSCAVLFALTFGASVWLTVFISIIWGISIIPDSAQFSVLVADYAEDDQAGSLLTFQTALGFALTIATVQLSPVIAAIIGWPFLMGLLALGPAVGIYAMWGLRKPDANQ
ncbi:MAG: MFS transporter [Granulosicoccus sp.]